MEMTKMLDDTIRHYENRALMRRYPIYLVPKDILDAVIEEQNKILGNIPLVIHVQWRGKFLIPISTGVIMPVNDMELADRLRKENELAIDKYFKGDDE